MFIMRTLFFLSFLSIPSLAMAENPLIGSWMEISSGRTIDILDGFKPNQGPILVADSEGGVTTSKWLQEGEEITIGMDYANYTASINARGQLELGTTYGDPKVYSPINSASAISTIGLKEDEDAFIAKLLQYKWLTSLNGAEAIFKNTFSLDSGVVELVDDGELFDLRSWGLASGALKIGSDVLLEGRISGGYFVGLNKDDNFVVFKSLGDAPATVTTSVAEERDAFFDAFLTGDWQTIKYDGSYIHKFRPIFGELSGVQFSLRDDRLNDDNKWEYSPTTGSLKLGYKEYVGALIVNGTLAFVETDGSQTFYKRSPNSGSKRFTLGDVKQSPLNEKSLLRVSEMLAPQLQRGSYLYQLEFSDELRTGYVHRFRSEPFNITGETFSSELISKSETLYQIEDFLVFGGAEVFKMDATASRLKPKSDVELEASISVQRDLQNSLREKNVVVRILKSDGTTVDVDLPVADFSNIAQISILTE